MNRDARDMVMAAIRTYDPGCIVWEQVQRVPATFAVIPKVREGCRPVRPSEALRRFALEVIKEHALPMVADPDGILCLVPSY